jgi:hypothetical protein
MRGNIQDTQRFNQCVEKIAAAGILKKEIAADLGMVNKKTGEGNISALDKLCNGTANSNNDRSVEALTSLLLSIEKYRRIIGGMFIDTVAFEFIFFFYYWSNHDEIRCGILGINLSEKKGRLIYFTTISEKEFRITHESDLKKIAYQNSDTVDLMFKSKENLGATFLSVHKGSIEIPDMEISFCSYCGAMGSQETQFAGIGILQRINKIEFEDRFKVILSDGIAPNIANVLYKRRFNLHPSESESYKTPEKINLPQIEPLKLVKGVWQGFYVRRILKNTNGEGLLCKVLMVVKENGIARIHFKESDDEKIEPPNPYHGFFKFPILNKATVVVGEFENEHNTNRLTLYLKPDGQFLEGIFTGWRTKDLGVFATPVYFERIPQKDSEKYENLEDYIKKLLEVFKPARYDFKNVINFRKEIERLKIVQKNFMEIVSVCLPDENL